MFIGFPTFFSTSVDLETRGDFYTVKWDLQLIQYYFIVYQSILALIVLTVVIV